MILLFLPFLLAIGVQSCREVLPRKYRVPSMRSYNQTLTESSEFFATYDSEMHTITTEMESRLRVDKILLERLLKVQEHCEGCEIHKAEEYVEICHGLFNKTSTEIIPKPDRTTAKPQSLATKPQSDSEKCKSFFNREKVCKNCTTPNYDEVNMIFTCTKGFAFDISTHLRQVRCNFLPSTIQLVYEVNVTNVVHKGNLECFPLPPEIVKIQSCPYECGKTAKCSENKTVCSCLPGYIDVSSQVNKPAGSICTLCNNSDPLGTDYVMLYDISSSINRTENAQMIDFVSSFLDFIDIDNIKNHFALVKFRSLAKLSFPLTPKLKKSMIIEELKYNRSKGEVTNTPDALRVANDEVYAKTTSNRPRVTILFTDGAPNGYYAPFENFPEGRNYDTNGVINFMLESTKGAEMSNDIDVPFKERKKAELIIGDFIKKDLRTEVSKMREIHKAQIITIYVGRNTKELNVKLMREITTEDQELSVDYFEDLKKDVLDRLQIKIC
ncbi:hypothetical protein PRIPAC_96788 [Pristionchus pacificus]|uniref:VWA domain-containing protein n=1 Tax=Pristionchus pacificus TaxID=54126 RepID=A0A2A6BXW0_PRIPA|nr:hypothetical protein PRIPAC_96788 [Pristionchus pacificus]|eukprot:PDM70686.1 VWA domain-containing protein [Pristionchus pacificus]